MLRERRYLHDFERCKSFSCICQCNLPLCVFAYTFLFRCNRVDNKREINAKQRNLEFFTTCYNYFVQIVPVAVVAPQYFAGSIQLGVISQSVGAFNHILNDLSVIVNDFEQLSSFSAGIERLSTFLTSMRDADPARSNEDSLLALPAEVNATSFDEEQMKSEAETEMSNQSIQLNLQKMPSSNGDNVLMRINQLRLDTPDRKRVLIDNLDLTIHEGQHLLISGSSGCGKSSLLRAIAGLWTAGSGSITRVTDDEVYFLPQRPYCALGSLKDQLLYPSTESLNPDDYPDGHRLSRSHLLRQSLTVSIDFCSLNFHFDHLALTLVSFLLIRIKTC